MLQECHNAAASLNAAGWYAEPRCRRRAGCRSLWKRHDKRHRRKRHFDERDSRHPNFEGANAELTLFFIPSFPTAAAGQPPVQHAEHAAGRLLRLLVEEGLVDHERSERQVEQRLR